jgi:uncharacterized phage protein (TIGR01671 family)
MNRQIKFRVWSKNQNIFLPAEDIAIRNNGAVLIYDWHNDFGKSWGPNYDEHIIQQFTGLTDKNGKEICEGDIVKTNCLKGEVVFRSGSWLFNGHPLINYEESLVIVGNVFENPELIQK